MFLSCISSSLSFLDYLEDIVCRHLFSELYNEASRWSNCIFGSDLIFLRFNFTGDVRCRPTGYDQGDSPKDTGI